MASVGKAHQIYTIQAMIGLSDVRIEETDNGRGTSFPRTFTSIACISKLPLSAAMKIFSFPPWFHAKYARSSMSYRSLLLEAGLRV